MAATTTITGAEFDALCLPDDERWELIHGEKTPMASPNAEHQLIVARLLVTLWPFLQDRGLAIPDLEFALSPNDRLRPDVAILLGDAARSLAMRRVPVAVVPAIAVEVISPSESSAASFLKRMRYLELGVAEVWEIQPLARKVEVHRLDGSHVVGSNGRLTSPLLPGLDVSVASFF